MNSETDIKNYEPHTLALNTFTAPTGYVFSGWCTVQDANATSTNPQTTCDSEFYRDGATISSSPSISATDGGTLTLYAYWQTPYTMQQFANGTADTTCTKLNIGERVTLIDARDSQEYTVAKLKDNKCWMTKNLNLAGGTILSSDTTDFVTNDPNYTLPTTNGWTTADNGTKLVMPESSASGFSDNNYAYVYNSNSEHCGNNSPCYSYYSWDAATLGSGRSISTGNTNVSYSICPKGWRLPTSTASNANAQVNSNWKTGDWYALATAYGADLENSHLDDSITTGGNFYNNAGPSTVPNFSLAGYYSNGSSIYEGSIGRYWSSTSNNGNAYNSYFSSEYMESAGDNHRRGGFSIRCLTEETVNDLTYMQDFAALSNDTKNRIINNMKTEETHTLKDKRDNQDYTIAKLKDGKVWMTENLNLAGGTALSAGDTDVTTAYINGFTTQANLTKSGNTISLPASATKNSGGNDLTDNTQFSDSSNAYVFNSGNETNCGASGQDIPCYSYYSWIAATLGGKQADGSTTQNGNGYNAAASICPKGWRLPTSTTSNMDPAASSNWKTGDWYALATAYGANLESRYYDDSGANTNFYSQAGPISAVPKFLLAGYYGDGSLSAGDSYGLYWSSTSSSSTAACYLRFYSSFVSPIDHYGRRGGFSVRCLLNNS